MNPMDILNLFFQYSLLHLYMPIVDKVGFSNPLTFTIIVLHNTFSLTYLLFVVAVAYPALHEKTWLIPAIVTAVWAMISINMIMTLNIPVTIAAAVILPHGWLEFTAIAYWTNAIRKATQNNILPEQLKAPTFKDYFKALMQPKSFIMLAKTDVQVSFKMTKFSLKTLSKDLKKAYLITLILTAIAALIETYITPHILTIF